MKEKKEDKNYIRATREGRLYIKTSDFFKSEKVILLVDKLKESSIYSEIEKSKE